MAAPIPTQAPTTTATPVVNFITGNKNKLSEVKAILEPTITVNSQALDLIEVQGTLEEVTLAKCRTAAEQVLCPASPSPCLMVFSLFKITGLLFNWKLSFFHTHTYIY